MLKENIKICGVDINIIFFNQTLRFFLITNWNEKVNENVSLMKKNFVN